jgi:lysophospholipase L1-like esterase
VSLAWLVLLMFAGTAPMQRVRIVAMGDSTTAGTPGFLSPLEAPPDGRGDRTSQYAYWLMKAHPDWDVLNRGINGERSDQVRARFERDVLEPHPAVVVLIAGVNDIYQGRSATQIVEQLRWMFERARRAGVCVVAGTIIPYNTATAGQNAAMREVNDWIRRQSGTAGIFVAETRSAVAAPGMPDILSETTDQLHPTAAGYRAMAEAIRPAIEQCLR